MNLINPEDTNNTHGSSVEELRHLTIDDQNNIPALNNWDLFEETLTEEQDKNEINLPTPQQAVGGDAGIMYLVNPSLFGVLFGNISVKQQPKANDRFRYESDGVRFLPDSRYHPLSIEVDFLFFLH